MKNYLEKLKKRGQIILLVFNVLLASGNMLILSTKLDKMGQGMILYCRVVNFTDTVCVEQ